MALTGRMRFCLRVTAASLLALAVVDNFNFPLHGLLAVLTASLVMQTSVGGRSARAWIIHVAEVALGGLVAVAVSCCFSLSVRTDSDWRRRPES